MRTTWLLLTASVGFAVLLGFTLFPAQDIGADKQVTEQAVSLTPSPEQIEFKGRETNYISLAGTMIAIEERTEAIGQRQREVLSLLNLGEQTAFVRVMAYFPKNLADESGQVSSNVKTRVLKEDPILVTEEYPVEPESQLELSFTTRRGEGSAELFVLPTEIDENEAAAQVEKMGARLSTMKEELQAAIITENYGFTSKPAQLPMEKSARVSEYAPFAHLSFPNGADGTVLLQCASGGQCVHETAGDYENVFARIPPGFTGTAFHSALSTSPQATADLNIVGYEPIKTTDFITVTGGLGENEYLVTNNLPYEITLEKPVSARLEPFETIAIESQGALLQITGKPPEAAVIEKNACLDAECSCEQLQPIIDAAKAKLEKAASLIADQEAYAFFTGSGKAAFVFMMPNSENCGLAQLGIPDIESDEPYVLLRLEKELEPGSQPTAVEAFLSEGEWQ